MYAVVIYHWKEQKPEMIRAVAGDLGITEYEVQQRMIGGSPVVLACFADPHQAEALSDTLKSHDMQVMIIDIDAFQRRTGRFVVRWFAFGPSALRIKLEDGRGGEIPYEKIGVILTGLSTTRNTETTTESRRKFSLGRTIVAGGIPMSKKVTNQKKTESISQRKVIYLFIHDRMPLVFLQDTLVWDGLGEKMKLSREQNFAFLTSELRRHCPGAMWDDRLLKRFAQVRLLGPTLNPDTYLDLAAAILARTLR